MRLNKFGTIVLFVGCYIGAVALLITSIGRTLVVGGGLNRNPTIIVDAGHGGFDGGAEGKNGTVEKDINLPIALHVQELLIFYGFSTIMTRETDVATCDDGITGISAKKTSDIMNRFQLMKKHPDSIFISIHQNKYPQSSSSGAQMFYGPQVGESEGLAKIMQANFIALLQPENHRESKKAEDSVYLLYHAPVPSVLVECGFLSNPADEALLRTEEYQRKIAFVIVASLLQYVEQGAYPQMENDSIAKEVL